MDLTGSCDGKKRYTNYAQMQFDITIMRRHYKHRGRQYISYRCQSCHYWHIGGTIHNGKKRKSLTKYNRSVFKREGLFHDGDTATGWDTSGDG